MAKKKNSISSASSAPKKSIIPLGDRVLVRPVSADETAGKTKSGIIIPETVDKEAPQKGIVEAVGAGRYEDGKLVPLTVKVKDTVVFSKYGFDEIELGGKEYLILKEDSILAIIK
jgi:chaperonin GroES